MGNQQTPNQQSSNSNLFFIGYNDEGPSGLGHKKDIKSLTQNPNNIKVENVYCGGNFTIFSTTNNELFACGWNKYGQCGVNTKNDSIIKCTPIDYFNKINKRINQIFINSTSHNIFYPPGKKLQSLLCIGFIPSIATSWFYCNQFLINFLIKIWLPFLSSKLFHIH